VRSVCDPVVLISLVTRSGGDDRPVMFGDKGGVGDDRPVIFGDKGGVGDDRPVIFGDKGGEGERGIVLPSKVIASRWIIGVPSGGARTQFWERY